MKWLVPVDAFGKEFDLPRKPLRFAALPRVLQQVRTLPLVVNAAQPNLVSPHGGSAQCERKEMIALNFLLSQRAVITPEKVRLALSARCRALEFM